MKREHVKLFIPLMQAYAEGKTIQWRGNDGNWLDLMCPSFGGEPELHRIKPEPINVKQWAVIDTVSEVVMSSHGSEHYANVKMADYRSTYINRSFAVVPLSGSYER